MKNKKPFQISYTLVLLFLACGDWHETENTSGATSAEYHVTENVITVSEGTDSKEVILTKSDGFEGNPSIKVMSAKVSPLNTDEKVYFDATINQSQISYSLPNEEYWVEVKNDFEDVISANKPTQIYWAFLPPMEALPDQITLEDVANVNVTLPEWPEFSIRGFGALGTDRYVVVEGETKFRLEDVAPGERSFYFLASVNDRTMRDTLLHIGPFLIKSGENDLSRPGP